MNGDFLKFLFEDSGVNFFFHGSPNKYNTLKPNLDSRTNTTGIFLSEYKFMPIVHSLLPEPNKIKIEYSAKNGRLLEGEIRTQKNKELKEYGYLYTVKITRDLIKNLELESGKYIYKKEIKPFKVEKVTIQDMFDLGWELKYKD